MRDVILCNPAMYAMFEKWTARCDRMARRSKDPEQWSSQDWRDEAETVQDRLSEKTRDYQKYRDLFIETRAKLARKRLKHRNTEMTLAAVKKRYAALKEKYERLGLWSMGAKGVEKP